MSKFILFFVAIFASSVLAASGGDSGNTTIISQQTVTASVTSTLVLAANSFRQYLMIQNNGATNVIVKFGSAQTGTEGLVIPANGGSYEMNKPATDAVYLRSASSTDSVRVVEGN